MDAVRPRQPVYAEAKAKAQAQAKSSRANSAVRIYQLDMPIRASTGKAWDLVDQQALPKVMRAAWKANGMRIGVMPSHRLDELRDALPRIPAVSQAKVFTADQYTPILSTNRLGVPIRVDLTVPPHPVREQVVRSGRLKLLLQARPGRGASGSSVIVEVVPHQYVPKLSLKPRSQAEKELDGQTFKALSLRVALSAGQFLVIGLDRPWDEPAPSPGPPGQNKAQNKKAGQPDKPQVTNAAAFNPTTPTQARTDQASQSNRPKPAQSQTNATNSTNSDDQANQEDLPPIGYHLGRALLTRRRAGHPQQTLLLIRLAK